MHSAPHPVPEIAASGLAPSRTARATSSNATRAHSHRVMARAVAVRDGGRSGGSSTDISPNLGKVKTNFKFFRTPGRGLQWAHA